MIKLVANGVRKLIMIETSCYNIDIITNILYENTYIYYVELPIQILRFYIFQKAFENKND